MSVYKSSGYENLKENQPYEMAILNLQIIEKLKFYLYLFI